MLHLAFIEGKFEDAEQQGQIAIKLEPLSAIDHADLAWTLYTAKRFEEALGYAKTGIELDANSFLSHRIAGLCYMRLNRHDEAIEALSFLIQMSNRHQHAMHSLIWAYSSNGNFKAARELMNELEAKANTEYIAGAHFGVSAAWLGELDKAFVLLERAYNEHDSMLLTLRYSPAVPVQLRKHPRFQSLLHRMGFSN